MVNDSFWYNFYKDFKSNIIKNSNFSDYIYEKYIENNNNVISLGDFGCGNCRDSHFFAEKGCQVYSIDPNGVNNYSNSKCNLILEDIELFLRKKSLNIKFDVIYMRWFLHAIPDNKRKNIFNHSLFYLNKGGLICIEVRSLNDTELIKNSTYSENDNSYTTSHKRWPLNREMLNEMVKDKQLEIIEMTEGYFSYDNYAETNNPLLIRCIIKKLND